MSISPVAPPERRVRHQAREAVALMVFSAAMSLAIALALLLVPFVAPHVAGTLAPLLGHRG